MIPKSRKSSESRKPVRIHEFAALARSSLNGVSQALKEHVTKPTSLAQGRVAHLIEWKGWTKISEPTDPLLYSHLSSYCHLSEGEQEARFAAGVAEQFAIAEAKLLAWASVDDDDEEEEDTDEDGNRSSGHTDTPSTHDSDTAMSNPVSRVPCQDEMDSTGEVLPSPTSTSLLGFSAASSSFERPASQREPPMPALFIAKETNPFLQGWAPERSRERLIRSLWNGGEVRIVAHKADWRPWHQSSRFDSCYSHSESPEEEEEEEEGEEEEEDEVFQEGVWHSDCRLWCMDHSSARLASFDEEECERSKERNMGREHLI